MRLEATSDIPLKLLSQLIRVTSKPKIAENLLMVNWSDGPTKMRVSIIGIQIYSDITAFARKSSTSLIQTYSYPGVSLTMIRLNDEPIFHIRFSGTTAFVIRTFGYFSVI